LIGQTIGNYLVTQKLGEGGMGSVYLAEHPTIGKKVALKVLHSEFSGNQEVAERFFNEAKAVNNIGHPNIVDIHDYGVIQAGGGRDQLVYFIMEYLAGVTLSHLIRTEAPLPPERALGIALQTADALSASHRCGIVHRDLKPDNIILLQRGRDRDFVKLLDFGIAKLTGDARPGSNRTRTGIVMGTPAYMSPEQCEGRGTVDLRTDIYALGIVLYEMLTGRVPFIGEGYGEILVQHLTQHPVPPSQFRMLNPHLEVVVLKALEKRAELRYPTMDEFMRAMSDPVGYVEAHGGVGQFLQRTLMPSTAPLPPVRLTPAPFTPPPGSLGAPVTGLGGYSTPPPTTLGGAAGEYQQPRSKAGFVIAGLLVCAAAGVGIAIVVHGQGKAAEPTPTVAAGTNSPAGGSDTTTHGAMPSIDASVAPVAVDAAVAHVAIDAGDMTVAHGSGAGAGSDSGATTPPLPETATITLTTKPAGAEIFVDGVDQHKKTPEPFQVSRKLAKVAITLKLDGYQDMTIKSFAVADNAAQTISLKKKSTVVIPHGTGSGKGSATTPTHHDDTGLERPD